MGVQPTRPSPGEVLRCSFCEKPQDQVAALISGPDGVAICDQCVELAREIIDEELTPPDRSA